MNTGFLQKISTKIAGISVVVTLFFLLMVFGILLPLMENDLMESRRDSLQALVDVAMNLIEEYDQRVQEGELTFKDARERFATRIKNMRFQNHDYFWVQDDTLPYPTMIMHPAELSLNGRTVNEPRYNKAFEIEFGDGGEVVTFPDRNKSILQAAVEVCLKSGGGFISYDWPKPTDTGLTRESYPKQSFVKYYEPWGWIIGTGLYFDDIKAEMAQLRRYIMVAVAVLIGVALFMTLVVMRNITRPLNALLRYSREVSRGNLDVQVSGRISGEFLQLKQSTETMVSTLRDSIRQARVKTEEAYRAAEKSKKDEQALQESRKWFATIFNIAQVGIVLIDARSHKIIQANPKALELMNAEGQDVAGAPCYEFICPAQKGSCPVTDLGQTINSSEEILLRTDGEQVPILKSVVSTLISDKEVLVESFIDITQRKQAEEERDKLQSQFLQAQKMESVGILAGGVAHDFNNLLQAMSANVELLLKEQSSHDQGMVRLKSLSTSLERAARLVRQLLLFSRKAETRRQKVDINQEVKDTTIILERTIPRMIIIRHHLDPQVWPISSDPAQIEQILLNLTSNAADAMSEGGTLAMETANVILDDDFVGRHPGLQPGRHVLLSVSDTGSGMDKKTLQNIFDPFFTTKEVGKGTGLGLATVYGIVKAHDGYIQCYSEPGQGTVFKIFFPALNSDHDEETVNDKECQDVAARGTETVLVVDDEQEIRELTREVLESLGYIVKSAASGEEALQIYRDHQQDIDLVLLDLNMPGMGGHKCIDELLSIDPEVKILVASGYSVNGHGAKVMSSGARGFIGKPYQIKELAGKLRQILDESGIDDN